MKERDRWDDAIRAKLYDSEATPPADGWERLAAALEAATPAAATPAAGRVVAMKPWTRYAAAAAVAALLLGGGGGYWYFTQQETKEEEPLTASIEAKPLIPDEKPSIIDAQLQDDTTNLTGRPSNLTGRPSNLTGLEDLLGFAPTPTDATVIANAVKQSPDDERDCFVPRNDAAISAPLTASLRVKPSIPNTSAKPRQRRWSVGFGGGGYSVSSSSSANMMSPTYSAMVTDYYRTINQPTEEEQTQQDPFTPDIADSKGGITTRNSEPPVSWKHKMPVSTGLGVSYRLTDRLSLNSGIVYTLLRAEGSIGAIDYKQSLHFLGVPLEASYRLYEWHKLRLYASAGGMSELNVYGIRKPSDESIADERIRIKEPLWSLNARAGVSYPLLRFLSVYAEGGASYYFDYAGKEEIETRSSKPFCVSIQAGFRFGF